MCPDLATIKVYLRAAKALGLDSDQPSSEEEKAVQPGPFEPSEKSLVSAENAAQK